MVNYLVAIHAQDPVFTSPQAYSLVSRWVALRNTQIMVGLPVDLARMKPPQLPANRKASRKGKVRCYHK